MLSLAKLLYQKVSYCSTWSINALTCQINVRTGWSILKKKCHSSWFFCNCSYTVTSHQFINSSAHEEEPNKETVFSTGEKKRNEGILAVGKEDCSSYRMSSKLALPAQVCIREYHRLLPCPHFHGPFEEKAGFGIAPRVFQARSQDEPGNIPLPCHAV